MKRLVQLFNELDATTATNAKVAALVRYLGDVSDSDKLWAIALFSGNRPPRAVNFKLLGTWASELAGLPEWLFVESYHVVGDYAETMALMIPEGSGDAKPLTLTEYMLLLRNLKLLSDDEKKTQITQIWNVLDRQERFIFNKLITGGLRIGVSQKLMMRALAQFTQQDENALTARFMGKWDPATSDYQSFILGSSREDNLSRPYPFCLSHALDIDPTELGDVNDWIVERKWDGIRGQVIVRDGQVFVWTRGEELVTEKYPEFHPLKTLLPSGTVIDGEILVYRNGVPLPFQEMQKRIGRKTLSKKIQAEIPVRMIAYDLIEHHGDDIRNYPQHERRTLLESLITQPVVKEILLLSQLVSETTWDALNTQRLAARDFHCEGLMLKRRDAIYEVGRKRGSWWKWKTDPFSVDCVMIYAQRGSGRRSNMYTDFTFAVWDKGQLVSFAKAYSGLSDAEFEEITRWVSQNTIERFGPVSIVSPVHVFELHFEGIGKSSRHKSGIAVRFPRISRWRKDKRPEDADRLEDLLRLAQ